VTKNHLSCRVWFQSVILFVKPVRTLIVRQHQGLSTEFHNVKKQSSNWKRWVWQGTSRKILVAIFEDSLYLFVDRKSKQIFTSSLWKRQGFLYSSILRPRDLLIMQSFSEKAVLTPLSLFFCRWVWQGISRKILVLISHLVLALFAFL